MCNLCNSLVLHCLYGGLGCLEERSAWEKINDFIIITKCFVITFLPFLLEEKKGDTSDAHTYLLREGAMGIGRRRGRWAKNIPINLDPLFMETQSLLFHQATPSLLSVGSLKGFLSLCGTLQGFSTSHMDCFCRDKYKE